MYDVLIQGGTLVDGTGDAARKADVAILGDKIVEISENIRAEAREIIDASDRIVTPGFVDLHTHYDGQATWDDEMAPSSIHGVTTVIMGNCGVGFAPAKPDEHEWLIELMEGVEDIPGSALAEGITWNWESYPEYLDELERMPRTLDVISHITHGALRGYVMGQRGADNQDATPKDIAEMARFIEEAVESGAAGFSTNRMPQHTSIHGVPVPGTFANREEFFGLVGAMKNLDRGVLQAIPSGAMGEHSDGPRQEIEMYRDVSLETGVTINFSLAAPHVQPELCEETLALVEKANAEGAKLVPQVQGRPAGLILGWDTLNPFIASPTCQQVMALRGAERTAAINDRHTKGKIISELDPAGIPLQLIVPSLNCAFRVGEEFTLEPDRDHSVAAEAARSGKAPLELLYDWISDGMVQVLFAGYQEGNLDPMLTWMRHPETVVGLADGGAHCSMVIDHSLPSFILQHWVRDRTRGDRLSLEEAIAMLTLRPAALYNLNDRGVLQVGKKADVNIINLDKIRLRTPEIISDLPTGASRIIQKADGYDATVCSGKVTFKQGLVTTERPGLLIRDAG